MLVLVVYGWLFAWFPALRSPNELSRLFQTRAMVRDRSLAIDLELQRHGAVGDLALKDGRYYAAKAPGISLLSVPAYAAAVLAWGGHEAVTERAAMFLARLLACAIPGALAAVVMRSLLRRWFDDALASAGAIVFALGTLMWPYSTQLAGHGTTAAALVASWYAIERMRSSDAPRWPILAGGAAACAIVVEYTSVLAAAALVLYAILTARNLARAAPAALLAALPPLLALGTFHELAFGSPLATPYAYLASPVYAAWHGRGVMGVGWPDPHVLAISLVDPAKGLFVYAPFLALGLPGLLALWRRDRLVTLLCAAVFAAYAAFTAGFTLAAWGWTIGPRHLTPACAFLVPPAVASADVLRRRRLGFVAAGLAGYSMAVFALICLVCPYVPDDLTNPLAQLVLPLARAGLHVEDVVGLATGAHAWWTLSPWAVAVAALVVPAWRALAGGGGAGGVAAHLGAVALALVLALGVVRSGGPDRFDETRRFMLSVYEPAAADRAGAAGPVRWPWVRSK